MRCDAHRARSRKAFWKLVAFAILLLLIGPHLGRHLADPEGTPLIPRPVAEFLGRFAGQRTLEVQTPGRLQREVNRVFAAVDGLDARDAAIESALSRESAFRPMPGSEKGSDGREYSYLPRSRATAVIRAFREQLGAGAH